MSLRLRSVALLLAAGVVPLGRAVPLAKAPASPLPPAPVPAANQTVAPADQELRPIREFDLETIAALGRELHRQDQLAWVATDVLEDEVGFPLYRNEGACGWVVETGGAEPVVRFLRRKGDRVEAAYDIRFPAKAKPVLETPQERTLTARQLARYAARETALGPFSEGKYPLCQLRRGNHFNYAVLDEPGGDGFLVYLLRPKEGNHLVPVGGHYRITVSGDGKTVKQVDALSASCLEMNRNGDLPEGGQLVSLGLSHVVSATPVETHVFLSLQEKLPFYVITPDGTAWQVEEGRIEKSTMKLPKPPAAPAPQ